MAFGALVERCTAQSDALVNGAAVANLGGLAHHHAHGMVKENPLAHHRTGMDFNARGKAPDVRHKATEPLETMGPEPVRAAVQHQRVQAGVARQHLPRAARSRVAVQNSLDIGAKA